MDRRNFLQRASAGAALAVLPVWSGLSKGESGGPGKEVALTSPGGTIKASIRVIPGNRLSYQVERVGRTVIEWSPLGIVVDELDLGLGTELAGEPVLAAIRESYPIFGNHAMALNDCRSALIPLLHAPSKTAWKLELRVADDGMAFRYLIPSVGPRTIGGEASGFKLPKAARVFYQTNTLNYEGAIQNAMSEDLSGVMGLPVTIKLAEGGFAALAEAAVYDYSGMTIKAAGDRTLAALFEDDKSWRPSPSADGFIRSPWRVVMAGETLGDLVNCDLLYNLNPPPSPELFADSSWIKPGRALWSWWSEGTGNPALTRKYIDAAQRLGFEYVLLDEGWEFWGHAGLDKWGAISDLSAYAGARGVKLWVWKRWKKLGNASYRNEFMAKVRAAGAVGVKIDFMDRESRERINFYEAALTDAARHRLMVNFHGANKPAGESRTYPHELTREGVRGLEYNKGGVTFLPARYNAALPFTRFLAGPGDYTPVTFDPRRMGKTSFAHQLACPLAFLSPLTHWADRPENYLENPATAPALEVIKAMPTVWDQTIVLPGSEIGECAVFARRSGKTWFIGALNSENPRDLSLALAFLQPGQYRALLLADHPDANDAFQRSEKTLGPADTLPVKMRDGGGFVAMLSPSA